jgi:hypothetical protein
MVVLYDCCIPRLELVGTSPFPARARCAAAVFKNKVALQGKWQVERHSQGWQWH